jgi:hypothetical protein
VPAQQRRLSAQDPVDKHVLGRRRRGRIVTAHQVDCQGAISSFRGRLLNVSRDGALVCLAHRRFKASADVDLVDVATRVEEEFPDGISVRFLDVPLTLKAAVVRLSRREDDSATLMGVEFERPLTFQECRLLGVRCTERDATS